MNKEVLLQNIDKVHTTEMGIDRIFGDIEPLGGQFFLTQVNLVGDVFFHNFNNILLP